MLLFLMSLLFLLTEGGEWRNFLGCDTLKLEGDIKDCKCQYEDVNDALPNFYLPLLRHITRSTFFRYFRVDLDRPCPFWHEEGSCMMEGCSVCVCDENEIPHTWLDEANSMMSGSGSVNGGGKEAVDAESIGHPTIGSVETGVDPPIGTGTSSSTTTTSSSSTTTTTSGKYDDFGWVSQPSSSFGFEPGTGHSDLLGRINTQQPKQDEEDAVICDNKMNEEDDEWIDMVEHECASLPIAATGVQYVNLLQNPESFTGYSGPSAKRVWEAIQQENCFGTLSDLCVEKRTFHRLMSGLQASISTHIAMNYFFGGLMDRNDDREKWGVNIPLYTKSVGSHPDRLNNLYFTFLFVLRAVAKAEYTLGSYRFYTGNATEDEEVSQMMKTLVSGQALSTLATTVTSENAPFTADLKCRKGFDESVLFQSTPMSSTYYPSEVTPVQELKYEFKMRFRNISKIMDCVSCEKCKVWGKLQILGLGTAVKILLSDEKDLEDINTNTGSSKFLNRQEVIALINTLNQLASSVEFASNASDLEFEEKLASFGSLAISLAGTVIASIAIWWLITFCPKRKKEGVNNNAHVKFEK